MTLEGARFSLRAMSRVTPRIGFLPLLAVALACGSPQAPNPEAKGKTSGEVKAESAPAELLDEPLADDPLGVTIHELPNGLTVYISPEPTEPRVSAWVAFRNGSRHDPADSTGLAHYLEHMLFKGTADLGTEDIAREQPHLDRIAALYDELKSAPTPRRASILKEIDAANAASAKHSIPNELDQLYAELGVSGVNAFTGEDMTVYVADVPSNRFEAWARVEASRYLNPKFRLFFPELETVYEEKNRSLDNPRSQVYETILAALYPKHPYGTQPTIGTVEHLKTPAYGDMVQYFRRWYLPNNAAIVLSGDITAEKALPVLNKYFGVWPEKPLSAPEAASMEPLKKRVERSITAPGEDAVHVAWATVPAGHRDELALEVMDLLVDNASTGLINIDLLLTQKLPRAGSSPEFMVESGYWTLRGTARTGQTHAQVEELLMGIVSKLKAGGFSQSDIDAIITNAEIDAKRELESRRARVSKMAFAFIQRRSWRRVSKKLERLRSIKKADIVRVANEYLGDGRVVLYRKRGETKLPKIEKPKITAIDVEAGRKSAFHKEVLAMQADELSPRFLEQGRDYQRQALSSGSLTAVKNQQNDLFELSYIYDVDPKEWPLMCIALKVANNAGAGEMDAETFKKHLYALGTTISTSCQNGVSVRVTGLDRNLASSKELVESLLGAPAFSDEQLKKVVTNEISRRKDMMGNPRFLNYATASYAAYDKRSSLHLAAPNRKLQKATAKQIKAALARLLGTKHRTLYFGPRAADKAAAAVSLGKSHETLPAPPASKVRKVKRSEVFLTPAKVAQSSISLYFPSPKLAHSDELWSQLYTEIVGGGMGSLIFQEIREARGLAYSASGYHTVGRRKGDQAVAMGVLGTQTDKTVEAVKKMLELLPVPPISDERFALAKSSLIRRTRSTRVPPRQIGRRVLSFEDRGYKADPGPAMWPRLQAATVKDVREFAKRIAGKTHIMSIVTDLKRVGVKDLKRFGKVRKLKKSELTSYDD